MITSEGQKVGESVIITCCAKLGPYGLICDLPQGHPGQHHGKREMSWGKVRKAVAISDSLEMTSFLSPRGRVPQQK
jgi:hypothetical protein